MNPITRRTILSLPLVCGLGTGVGYAQTKEVTIAHQDMIVPFRVQQAAGAVEKATGYKINWKMFGGGGDVIKAMASGEVPIGEVGSSPATAAAAQGMDVQIVWILDDINDAEQLVVSQKSGITKLADLKGKKIATPLASTAHYQLMFALTKAGINPKEVQILNMRPPEIAAAWERGDLDGTFIWDPVLSKVKTAGGKMILSSADVAKQGAPTFDAVMVNKAWADKNKPFVTALVKEMAKADATYKVEKAKYTVDSDLVKTIAKVVGAEPKDVPQALADYRFPTAAEQASNAWLAGGKDSGVAKAMANTATFLKEQGRITNIPADFGKFVNPEYAAAAK
ncbi:MAG: taurine ABC transporter substrate-binding protein [Alphaproteobacteria bacterium]|nr:taurine ABC transporter substrate-binding protein [Alphaproteobacteria bacterium]